MSRAEVRFVRRLRRAYDAPLAGYAETRIEVRLPDAPFRMRDVSAANVGGRDIAALWVYANDDFNLYSARAMMAGVKRGDAEAAAERIMALRRRYYRHHPPVSVGGLPHDPAALFGALGYGVCDDIAYAAARLGRVVGVDIRPCDIHLSDLRGRRFEKPFDHYINLIKTRGRVVPADFDQGILWRGERGRLASLDQLAAHPALARRVRYEWVHEGCNVSEIMAAVFARFAADLKRRCSGPAARNAPRGRFNRLRLPVGAAFTWRFRPPRRLYRHGRRVDLRGAAPNAGEGVFAWVIDRRVERSSRDVMRCGPQRLAAVMGPYVMTGGALRGRHSGLACCDEFISAPPPIVPASRWRIVSRGAADAASLTPLFEDARGAWAKPRLGCVIRARPLEERWRLEVRVQISLAAAPRLRPGRNVVRLVGRAADVKGPFRVRVTPGPVAVIESDRLRIRFAGAAPR